MRKRLDASVASNGTEVWLSAPDFHLLRNKAAGAEISGGTDAIQTECSLISRASKGNQAEDNHSPEISGPTGTSICSRNILQIDQTANT
jgi:hypothetical protein